MAIAALVINFNTAQLTLRCIASLADQEALGRILVLDNASAPEDLARLRAGLDARAELICSPHNLGFAAGSNLGIDHLLADPSVHAILLLNSDAEAGPGLVAALGQALDPERRIALIGAPMHRFDDPACFDSLGIAFYASCLASNRIDARDPLFGPTGGCALYARVLLEDLTQVHGYCFDAAFFCYAEDTDLAARALLLGYRPALIEAPSAHHHGQASSGGGFSTFVLYHGIRNSIWTLLKCVPTSILVRRLPWIAAMHAGILLRHTLRGEARTLLRLYRDALARLPAVLRQRRAIQRQRRIEASDFARYLSPRFYDQGYVRDALRSLFRRPPPRP